jgi:hypothetical protein
MQEDLVEKSGEMSSLMSSLISKSCLPGFV